MTERLYTPKPAAGKIEMHLAGKNSQERQKIKTEIVLNIPHERIRTFTVDGFFIEVESGPSPTLKGNGIHFFLKSAKMPDGTELPIDKGGYIVVNPPLKIPAGTWRKEKLMLPNGEVIGETDFQNHIESPEEAIKYVLLEGVKAYARTQGYQL
jgi:hypothetical protein